MKKASLSDIADSLGVSKTLVSLVLNNKGNKNGISQNTQKKVFAKAKELNYQPNQMARGLRLGRSETIGLIVADISNTFFARIARKIEDAASKHGYNVIYCSSDEKPEKEIQLIRMLKDRQVDGIILSSTLSDPTEIKNLIKENYPIVLIDRYFNKLNAHHVRIDNKGGALNITQHLINLGHQRIGILSVTPSHISTIADRVSGYKEALKQNGIKFNSKLNYEIGFHTLEKDVLSALKGLLKPPTSATAIFATNNIIARMCIRKLKEMNLQIPRDVALVSFDDIELFEFNYPPITAVSQPVDEIGENAVSILINQIKNKNKDLKTVQQIVLPTNLVIRKSCGSYLHNL